MVFLPSWLQGIIPPGLAHSSPLAYNQLFHNHLVEYTAVQGIFSINTVRLPWRQIAWCQLLHGVGNLQSPDIVVTRVASGSHSPGSLKGDGVWKPSGSSLGRKELCCFCVWLPCSAPAKNNACLTFRIWTGESLLFTCSFVGEVLTRWSRERLMRNPKDCCGFQIRF